MNGERVNYYFIVFDGIDNVVFVPFLETSAWDESSGKKRFKNKNILYHKYSFNHRE